MEQSDATRDQEMEGNRFSETVALERNVHKKMNKKGVC